MFETDLYNGVPPEPPDLQTAVKDYIVWMQTPALPLDHRFQMVKQRIINQAIKLVQAGGGCR